MQARPSIPRARSLRGLATDAERNLWLRLRNRLLGGWKFRRQHVVGPYVADFACIERRLIVELDGGQHVDRAAADEARTAYLQTQGYRVLRYWNDEVLLRLDDVLADVLRALEKGVDPPSPQPSPASGRGSKASRLPPAGEGAKHRASRQRERGNSGAPPQQSHSRQQEKKKRTTPPHKSHSL